MAESRKPHAKIGNQYGIMVYEQMMDPRDKTRETHWQTFDFQPTIRAYRNRHLLLGKPGLVARDGKFSGYADAQVAAQVRRLQKFGWVVHSVITSEGLIHLELDPAKLSFKAHDHHVRPIITRLLFLCGLPPARYIMASVAESERFYRDLKLP